MMRMKIIKCPTEELSLKNCAGINSADFPEDVKYIEVTTTSYQNYVFTVEKHSEVPSGCVAFSSPQRKWAILSINAEIEVRPFQFNSTSESNFLSSIVLEADFAVKTKTTTEVYDSDLMVKDFLLNFSGHAFTVGQQLVFKFGDKKLLTLIVKDLEELDVVALEQGQKPEPKKTRLGRCFGDTVIRFEKAERSTLNLIGKSRGHAQQSLINQDWDFEKMGIGGLDKEFSDIFRRAFGSRLVPTEIVTSLDLKHVKGILLYGLPGTGKTLLARKIGSMLSIRQPKIVNGPQILDKYVGESEANIRRLFAEAEEEEKMLGPNSGLHVIIFDEIDAICKARGSVVSSSGVQDSIVTQLLSKIDGVEQLNNILIIGMTNRRDMIDEALLRPGRLELQVEIGLPDEAGRIQILGIHTSRMREHNKMADDVDLKELAMLTNNFSGADLAGLVRAAQSLAIHKLIKVSNKVEVDPLAMEKFMVSREDFMYALENDVRSRFVSDTEVLNNLLTRGIINWGNPVTEIISQGNLSIQATRNSKDFGLVTVLLEGPPNSGKTALAAQIAKNSEFPYVKVFTPVDMPEDTENNKAHKIRKVFEDSRHSQLSCLVIDNIEDLIEFVPIGPRFSTLILKKLKTMLTTPPPAGKKLLVICTTSDRNALDELGLTFAFSRILHVPNLSESQQVLKVLEDQNVFTDKELTVIDSVLEANRVSIGIKKLLGLINLAREVESSRRELEFLSILKKEGAYK